jgi:hypothetical protein
MEASDKCPAYAPFFGVMGATSAMVFTGLYQLSFTCYLILLRVFLIFILKN